MAIGQSKLHKLLKNITRLNDVLAWYAVFDGETKNRIIELIQQDQLQEGIGADGEVLGLYSYATELITNGEKQEGTPYTLYDTGDFYRSMYMVVLRDAIVIEGDTDKMKDNNWWSNNDLSDSKVLNLTTQSREKMKQFLINNYREYVRREIFRAL